MNTETKLKRTFLISGLEYTLPSDAAHAVGRFEKDGPNGYKASNMPDAPLRGTRSEAEQDYIDKAEGR